MRGHFNPVAEPRDIKKAFLQVRIRVEDRDALTFHWVRDIGTRDKDRLARALSRLTSSRFLSAGLVERHVDSSDIKYPEIVKEIKKEFYVDVWIGGGSTIADTSLELQNWH